MWKQIKETFRAYIKTVWITVGKTTEVDPYEHTFTVVEQNPVPLQAIVKDLTAAQAQYKMLGVQTSDAKELLISKQFRQWVELSRIIKIDGREYYAWKDAAGVRNQVREVDDILRIYVYSKPMQ